VIRSVYFGSDEPLLERYSSYDYKGRLYDSIQRELYILKGPEGHIMMPKVWESIIKPEGQITLSFLSQELNDGEIEGKNFESKYEPNTAMSKRDRIKPSLWEKIRDIF